MSASYHKSGLTGTHPPTLDQVGFLFIIIIRDSTAGRFFELLGCDAELVPIV